MSLTTLTIRVRLDWTPLGCLALFASARSARLAGVAAWAVGRWPWAFYRAIWS